MTQFNGPMTWTDATILFDNYLAAGGSPSTTRATRRSHLQLAAKALPGDPWSVTAEQLVAWFASMGCAQETRRGRRATMRRFYGWGVDAGHVDHSIAEVLPPVKAAPPAPRPVSDEAYRYALARADERVRLMIRLAAECGLRRAEVAQIHSRDLVEDLGGWSLTVHGKGGRDRLVPLPAGLASQLRTAGRGWLFPGRDAGHLSPRWVGTLVARCLPDAWTMHKLRHRAATRWYAVDRDTFTVQDLLGHASPATTRAYVLVPRDALRRTVEAAAS